MATTYDSFFKKHLVIYFWCMRTAKVQNVMWQKNEKKRIKTATVPADNYEETGENNRFKFNN